LAHGSISFVRTGRIPLVSSLAAAISDVGLDAADHRLDVSIIPVYVMWYLRALGRPWGALPGWVMLVEYGCVAAAGAILVLHKVTRPTVQCSTNEVL